MRPTRLALFGGVLLGAPLLLMVSLLGNRPPARADEPTATTPSDAKAPVNLPSPKTWPPGKVIFEQSETEKKIRAALEQPAELDFLDTQLGDVVHMITEKYDIAIDLDREALAADGKGPETPITKAMRDTTLGNILHLILDGQGLTTLVKNDTLLITTKAAASQPENLIQRVYQVHDLVVAANDPTASQPDFEQLIELLTYTVRQTDWADNGGTIGAIHSYSAPGILALIVQHDARGHREIESLLSSLRAARITQVVDAQAQQPLERRIPQAKPAGCYPPKSHSAEVQQKPM